MGLNISEMIDLLWKKAKTFRYPTLFVHGEEDRLTLPGPAHDFYSTIPSADKNIHIVEGGMHDMSWDKERGKVISTSCLFQFNFFFLFKIGSENDLDVDA